MPYESERFDSNLAQCGQLKLLFEGSSLVMYKQNLAIYDFPAVSGKPLPGNRFDYSPERQKKKDTGPIPEGTYFILPTELSPAGTFRRTSAWGNYRITIHPFPNTQTHERSGFFIHGGAVPGSAGCIDLTEFMDIFVEKLREEIAQFGDCKILLTVEYS